MNYKIALSLFLVAGVCNNAISSTANPKEHEFLLPRKQQTQKIGHSLGGMVDGLIGAVWPDTFARRWYEAINFWGWAQELDRKEYKQIYLDVAQICIS